MLAILTAPDQATANTLGKMMNPYLLNHFLIRKEKRQTFAFHFLQQKLIMGRPMNLSCITSWHWRTQWMHFDWWSQMSSVAQIV
ncbi:MAG: hypothetical protein ACI901_000383 [Octadecabacter sp.]